MLLRRSEIRKKAAKAKRRDPLRVPSHYQYVGGFACCVCGAVEGIHRHHLTTDIPWHDQGGGSRKNHDKWCVPLCHACHREVHNGERTFQRERGVNLKAIAEALWARSPHRRKYEMMMENADG